MSALRDVGQRPFGFYVHIPFCASRCGYCDFNTYTADELGDGVSQRNYADIALGEIRLARHILGNRIRRVDTVFFGGGTPTLLPSAHLSVLLAEIDELFGLAPEAEITVEANPETLTASYLARLREAGFNRLSIGMQSVQEHVLAVLDRQHTPGRAIEAVLQAREAGFTQVNLDLIYGTPGETETDWQATLDAAIDARPDHISAYGLIVERGTRLAAKIGRGELPTPDDDVLADRYVQLDEALNQAGYSWYEISNFSRGHSSRCQHNRIYWGGDNWWGIGPGAHSHIGGTRWWNVKHPRTYARLITSGHSPADGHEVLTDKAKRMERVLLGLRMREGIPLDELSLSGRQAAGRAVTYGLLERLEYLDRRAVLTLRGRLLADAVVRDLID